MANLAEVLEGLGYDEAGFEVCCSAFWSDMSPTTRSTPSRDGSVSGPYRRRVSVRPFGKTLALAASAALVVGLFAPAWTSSPAAADDLDDQASQLQQQANDVQSSLEFVDAGIAKTASDLTLYNGQLPGARKAVEDAQNAVASATDEVNSLSNRLNLAQKNRDDINASIKADQDKLSDSKKTLGVIAAQTYKSGGIPNGLTLFTSGDPTEKANGIALADQALSSQKMLVTQLSERGAIDKNAKERLAAVESQITDLKAQADTALQQKQAAQADASSKKSDLDRLLDQTTQLSKQLNAKRPEIESKLAQVKQAQQSVADQIADRQRKEREEWLAQQRAAAEAAGNNNYQPPAAAAAPDAGSSAANSWGLSSPFPGIAIISGFGMRQVPPGTLDPLGTGYYMHSGVDFAATCGTPVHAAGDGTVVGAGWYNNGGGNGVEISHGVVNGNALSTMYYHNTSVVVSKGQHVTRGQVIAYSGTTGNSNGCHAHVEVWLNGVAVDPAPFF